MAERLIETENLEISVGDDDDHRGIKLGIDGESFWRITLTPQGTILVGDGASPPIALTGTGVVVSIGEGDGISVDASNPAVPIVSVDGAILSTTVTHAVVLTQAEYDALAPADATTLYITSDTNTTYLGANQIGGGGGASDHGALTGLADNDHPQYVVKAGDTMTGTLGLGGTGLDGTNTQSLYLHNLAETITALYTAAGVTVASGSKTTEWLAGSGQLQGEGTSASVHLLDLLNSAGVQWSFREDGKVLLGTAGDVNLYRAAADLLATDDAFRAVVLEAAGMAGSTENVRLVGGLASGAPSSEAHLAGDVAVALDGHIFVCTVAGTPGTWVDAGLVGLVDTVNLTGAQSVAGVKTFTSDPIIPDEAYDATAWNGVLEPPTKNAVRDVVEALPAVAAGTNVTVNTAGDPPISTISVEPTFAGQALDAARLAFLDGTGVAVTNTTTETSLLASPWTIPANRLAVGSVVHLSAWGTRVDNNGSGSTSTLRVRVGGVAGTSLGSFVVPARAASSNFSPWRWDATIVIVNVSGLKGRLVSRFSLGDPNAANADWQRTSQSISVEISDILSASKDWVLTTVNGSATDLSMISASTIGYITDPL